MFNINNLSFEKIYKKKLFHKRAILGFICLIFIALIGVGIISYNNKTNNPTVVKTITDFNNAIKNNSYVNINSDDIYTLDIIENKGRSPSGSTDRKYISHYFILIKFDEKFLISKISPDDYDKLSSTKGPYTLKGNLQTFNDDDLIVIKEYLTTIDVSDYNIDLSFYLSYYSPSEDLWGYLFISFIFFSGILPITVFSMNKNNSLKDLIKYYNCDEHIILKEIDEDLKAPNLFIEEYLIITENYIIINYKSIISAFPLKALISVETTTKFGFTTFFKRFNYLALTFSYGKHYPMIFKKQSSITKIEKYLSSILMK